MNPMRFGDVLRNYKILSSLFRVMNHLCPLCSDTNSTVIYDCENLPLFQNVVFSSQAEAADTIKVNIELRECHNCGFVWNSLFNEELMVYDENYQNEQGLSVSFDVHLNDVVRLIAEKGYKSKKIVEIGCGKGLFLAKLKQAGFTNVMGFDPAYEGDVEDIVPAYFCENSMIDNADLIILRHVLEHIARPADFLQMITRNNRFHGEIYIEVPDFRWILNHGAFWDIYNEHCNYFTTETLSSLFGQSESHSLFHGQYIGLLAPLKGLRTPNVRCHKPLHAGEQNGLHARKSKYIDQLELLNNRTVVLWGASSKGVIWSNLLDPNRKHIHFLVDINPKKQGKFIGGTGHAIYGPDYLKQCDRKQLIIFVVNENYFDEIQGMINDSVVEMTCL